MDIMDCPLEIVCCCLSCDKSLGQKKYLFLWFKMIDLNWEHYLVFEAVFIIRILLGFPSFIYYRLVDAENIFLLCSHFSG